MPEFGAGRENGVGTVAATWAHWRALSSHPNRRCPGIGHHRQHYEAFLVLPLADRAGMSLRRTIFTNGGRWTLQATSPNRPGHDLALEVNETLPAKEVLTGQRLSDQRPAPTTETPLTPH
jgi:hypothetical protein